MSNLDIEQLKLKILQNYSEDSLLQDEALLSKLKAQLEGCQERIAQVQERESNIKEVVRLANKSSINISAALEWQEIKDETAKVNGRAIKLHKEITTLTNKIKRRKDLRNWAKE